MTVIAWDGKSIAADRRAERGRVIEEHDKLFPGPNGSTISFAGEAAKGLLLVEWYCKGRKLKDWPKFQSTEDFITMIVAGKDGKVDVYYDEPIPVPFSNNFNAWGSGAPFAIGAMAAGATPLEACKIAGKHCVSCGNGYDVIYFED